jgi:ATP-dependent helicase/DNAse subunit B
VPLTLITGPANAGKVELLLERYLAALEREPVLIVPGGADVERVERDLLRRAGALFGGSILTFDDLFRDLARGLAEPRPVATDTQRRLLVRRVVAGASLNGLGASARTSGFAESLAHALAELEDGLVEPDDHEGHLALLHASYRAELDQLRLVDRQRLRRLAAERLATDLAAWDGRPVFAYGFEDLTGAEWRLLEALAGRAEVTVSLPYEPARPAFASLERTANDLARLAAGQVEELPPRYHEYARPALAHLERALFGDRPPAQSAPPLDGAIRFLEGAGGRATLELVADELLQLLRDGTPAERIAVVCPSLERFRAPLETAFASLGVPYALEGTVRLAHTTFGQALLSLLRFAWLGGTRRDLYAFLRSPFSGLTRANVDYLEGRLRGRKIDSSERVEAETVQLRGQPIPWLAELRGADEPIAAVRELARGMLRAAYGLDGAATGDAVRLDLRAYETTNELLAELAGWESVSGERLAREELPAALERGEVRLSRPDEPGRVTVCDLLRARTRQFDVVVLLGLEEGSFPRRAQPQPFLDEERRRDLEDSTGRARLVRADSLARERFLFYVAATRARQQLLLVREAATDDGSPRQASPFWDELRRLWPADEVARATRRRALSQIVWPLEGAPSERERLRAVAQLAASAEDESRALARANGWERRLDRALAAFTRDTTLHDARILEQFGSRQTFGVTELESFADCSSKWFFERVVDPRAIDAEVDARLRGQVAHQALYKFVGGLPKELGVDRIADAPIDDALRFLRTCLDDALRGQVRLELTELEQRELEHGLWRDLEQFVRDEADTPLALVPRHLEILFGSDRAQPHLQRGLDLGELFVSGKIDRIDVDPFSARGIVQDYKSGRTAHSASQIEQEKRLQIPLYMLVLRDLVGIEPMGGLYRALAGEREARGLLRESAREDGVPGMQQRDYKDEDAFWSQVEGAAETARGIARRIRAGDVIHDPRWDGGCPAWCELYSMCRVKRA